MGLAFYPKWLRTDLLLTYTSPVAGITEVNHLTWVYI
jgi:hypothetical protein